MIILQDHDPFSMTRETWKQLVRLAMGWFEASRSAAIKTSAESGRGGKFFQLTFFCKTVISTR